MHKRRSVGGILWRAAAAGALGSGAMELFFRSAARWAPPRGADAFRPAEPDALPHVGGPSGLESKTQRLAHRVLALGGGTPSARAIDLGSEAVHYAFGAAWGPVYGAAREAVPAVASVGGVALFGLAVWLTSDYGLLPPLRLSRGPSAYPGPAHAYALTAHLVYAATTALAYEKLRAS